MLSLFKQLVSEKISTPSSFEEMKNISDKRFKKLLRHALTHSAFYKKFYADHGIFLKDVDQLKMEDLPFTTKKILMENFDEVSCNKKLKFREIEQYLQNAVDSNVWYQKNFKIIKTSGSSGSYGVFPYHKKSIDLIKALMINRVSQVTPNPFRKIRFAILVETNGLLAGVTFLNSAPKIFYETLLISVQESQQSINKKLNDFKPDIISGYANTLFLCAHEQLASRLNIHPKQISCSGEPLTNEAKQVIKKAFNIEATNAYCASESFYMASSTQECQNLHVAYDWNIFEVIDESGKVVANNNLGNAVLTNLYNYSFPLIRYKTNDKLAIDFCSCKDCNSIFPVITQMEGRIEDNFRFIRSDGTEEYISSHFSRIFDEKGIKSFQVIQTEKKHLKILLVLLDGESSDKIIIKLNSGLNKLLEAKNLIGEVSYDFLLVNEIKVNPKTGKFAPLITFEKYQKQLENELSLLSKS